MMQMRPAGGGLPYAPFRDLVNCFPSLAKKAAHCLAEDAIEPWFKDYLDSNNVTNNDLCDAAKALAMYINGCRQPELASPVDVLNASEFTNLKPAAQLAILTKVGQVVMAMFYAVSRDALRSDEKPFAMDALLKYVDQVCKQLTTPRSPEM